MATVGDWIVVFEFNQQPRRLQTPFEKQWNLNELKQGFWIDADHQLCHESQGRFWIPPSRIMWIEPVGQQL